MGKMLILYKTTDFMKMVSVRYLFFLLIFYDSIMRFTLTLVSTAMLANMALAAPANPQQNSEIEVNGFNPAQTAALQLGEQFQPFNWKAEGEQKTVDRTFSLDLAEPAELQITDYKLGKYPLIE